MSLDLDWNKMDGLIPAMIQDSQTRELLMLGYMSPESLALTQKNGEVTFYSRSRKALWTKGETSGNRLKVVELKVDCDRDALLILVEPTGPACHRLTPTCFDGVQPGRLDFLSKLERTLDERFEKRPSGSYVAGLIEEGLDRAIQKVGEEAVETVIAAKNPVMQDFEGEAADLLFHLMVLLKFKGSSLGKIVQVLASRS